jgi:hypothetical protein
MSILVYCARIGSILATVRKYIMIQPCRLVLDTHVKIELREMVTSLMGPNADIAAIVRYD